MIRIDESYDSFTLIWDNQIKAFSGSTHMAPQLFFMSVLFQLRQIVLRYQKVGTSTWVIVSVDFESRTFKKKGNDFFERVLLL